eukprot:3791495-Pyramimonas_sp.AAC.2
MLPRARVEAMGDGGGSANQAGIYAAKNVSLHISVSIDGLNSEPSPVDALAPGPWTNFVQFAQVPPPDFFHAPVVDGPLNAELHEPFSPTFLPQILKLFQLLEEHAPVPQLLANFIEHVTDDMQDSGDRDRIREKRFAIASADLPGLDLFEASEAREEKLFLLTCIRK